MKHLLSKPEDTGPDAENVPFRAFPVLQRDGSGFNGMVDFMKIFFFCL
jgi:hypothetical protein